MDVEAKIGNWDGQIEYPFNWILDNLNRCYRLNV